MGNSPREGKKKVYNTKEKKRLGKLPRARFFAQLFPDVCITSVEQFPGGNFRMNRHGTTHIQLYTFGHLAQFL